MTSPKEDHHHKTAVAWQRADEEERRAYVIWQYARERRDRIWAQLQQAATEVKKERATP